MQPFSSPTVQATFDRYPPAMRSRLLQLRELIFATAAGIPGVGPLEETLKWGEPAYLTSASKSGSMVRIAWKSSKPNEYAVYFLCQTTLIATFRMMFPADFRFEGNRAIVFTATDIVPMASLASCLAMAFTYNQPKPPIQIGSATQQPGG